MSRKETKARAKELADQYGYLQYMIERYLTLWGEEETLQFLQACEQPIRTAIRINTLKNEKAHTLNALRRKGIAMEEIPWLQYGYYADFGRHSPGALLEHMLGFYYIQGVPSMTAVEVLDPQPDEVVADLAAAPGGKTTHLAQMMKNTGLVLAVEQDRLRIDSLRSNILRCGVTNSLVLRGDAKKIDGIGLEPTKMLLDAPCSGEGLIPLDPSRKTSKTMADIQYCATREDDLLDAAIRKLSAGGQMVYSTCSIAPEENEYVVDNILRRYPEVRVIPIDIDFGSPGYSTPYGVQLDDSLKHSRRFLPHLHGTEGFFICKMEKMS
ncbi:MAG: RsmB/NOP family class I SAM-dependent RNA methyltransferase [Candidatus Thorarchaeota archaeon]